MPVSNVFDASAPTKFGWLTADFWFRYEKYHHILSTFIGPPTFRLVSRYVTSSLLPSRMPDVLVGENRNLAGTFPVMLSD
jgi:hypothetical protein